MTTAAATSTNSSGIDLDISEEFIKENRQNLSQFVPKSRGRGPYSKQDKQARRNEVYRLHFEYGYSARKIADMMKVNRNTVTSDIDYWYSKIVDASNIFNPEHAVIINLQRLEIQRTRLREQLDKTNSHQEKLAIERLIFDVDSKILHTYQRLGESARRLADLSTEQLNDWLKDNRKEGRYMTLFDKILVSPKAHEKIERIIKEDKVDVLQFWG